MIVILGTSPRMTRFAGTRPPAAFMFGRVTVPHPERDIPMGTLKSIERQSGLKLR